MSTLKPDNMKIDTYLSTLDLAHVQGVTHNKYVEKTGHKVRSFDFNNRKRVRLLALKGGSTPKREKLHKAGKPAQGHKFRTIRILASIPLETFTVTHAELKIFANTIAKQIGKEYGKEWEAVLFADPPTLEIRAFV